MNLLKPIQPRNRSPLMRLHHFFIVQGMKYRRNVKNEVVRCKTDPKFLAQNKRFLIFRDLEAAVVIRQTTLYRSIISYVIGKRFIVKEELVFMQQLGALVLR